MQWIEILETLAPVCKTPPEVPALDEPKSRRDSKPPVESVGRGAKLRPSAVAQVARGARAALELSRFVTYLLRLAEYLNVIGG